MRLDSILQCLEDNGIGIQGTDLFAHRMPYTTQNGVLVRQKLIGDIIDGDLPLYIKAEFQVIVRDPQYEDGYLKMQTIMEALTISETSLQNFYVKRMRPLRNPVVYPVSEGDLIEMSVIFECVHVENT